MGPLIDVKEVRLKSGKKKGSRKRSGLLKISANELKINSPVESTNEIEASVQQS